MASETMREIDGLDVSRGRPHRQEAAARAKRRRLKFSPRRFETFDHLPAFRVAQEEFLLFIKGQHACRGALPYGVEPAVEISLLRTQEPRPFPEIP